MGGLLTYETLIDKILSFLGLWKGATPVEEKDQDDNKHQGEVESDT